MIFNDRLEACQFRARLKPATSACSRIRTTWQRHAPPGHPEFSAYAPDVLGVCVSQDSYISSTAMASW